MTSSVIRKYVLAALCGAAIVGVGQSAQAATWNIVLGVPSAPTTPTAGIYGPLPGPKQRSKQSTGANQRYDKCPWSTCLFSKIANLNATFVGSYNVNWFYVGSESDNTE